MAILQAETSFSGSVVTGDFAITKTYWVDTEEDAIAIATGLDYRYYLGYPLEDFDGETVSESTIRAGFRVDLTYKAQLDEDEEDDEDEDLDTAVWDFRPAFSKEPIEKHPDIDSLIENYAGAVDPKTKRVIFDRTLTEAPRDDRRGLLGQARTIQGELQNPLFGLSESGYIVMSGLATARLTTTRTENMLAGVGKVYNSLPSGAPDYGVPEGYNWLKAPPQASEIGRREDGTRRHDLEYSFMLSPEGGWPPGVYKFIEV